MQVVDYTYATMLQRTGEAIYAVECLCGSKDSYFFGASALLAPHRMVGFVAMHIAFQQESSLWIAGITFVLLIIYFGLWGYAYTADKKDIELVSD